MKASPTLSYLAMSISFAFAACSASLRSECSNLDADEIIRCFEGSDQTIPESKTLLKCFPFSEVEQIEGVWVVGFERNEFFEGDHQSESLPSSKRSGTSLVVEDELFARPEGSEAFRISITGRRSACEFTQLTPNLIVVSELKIVDRIGR